MLCPSEEGFGALKMAVFSEIPFESFGEQFTGFETLVCYDAGCDPTRQQVDTRQECAVVVRQFQFTGQDSEFW